MSLRTVYRRVREQARWSRPRLIAKGDPDYDTICAAIRDQVASLPRGSVVLAKDSTHLDLLARVRACWMPTGIRHRILIPGSSIRHTIHGAIDLATGTWHHHLSVRNVSIANPAPATIANRQTTPSSATAPLHRHGPHPGSRGLWTSLLARRLAHRHRLASPVGHAAKERWRLRSTATGAIATVAAVAHGTAR